MFLPTLACPSSRVGVIISPLNCLMDEQVQNLFSCVQHYCCCVKKIMKLKHFGVHAIRVTAKDADLMENVENGNYRFGE